MHSFVHLLIQYFLAQRQTVMALQQVPLLVLIKDLKSFDSVSLSGVELG